MSKDSENEVTDVCKAIQHVIKEKGMAILFIVARPDYANEDGIAKVGGVTLNGLDENTLLKMLKYEIKKHRG